MDDRLMDGRTSPPAPLQDRFALLIVVISMIPSVLASAMSAAVFLSRTVLTFFLWAAFFLSITYSPKKSSSKNIMPNFCTKIWRRM
jgi:hypothetical protein